MNNSALSHQCGSYGSNDCPCVLSVLGECLVCSHLRGKDFCDCEWNKYCVYINYLHDRKTSGLSGDGLPATIRWLNMGAPGYRVFLPTPRSVLSTAREMHLAMLRGGPPDSLEIPAVVLALYPDHGLVSLAVSPISEALHSRPGDLSLSLVPGSRPAVNGLDEIAGASGRRVLVVAGGFGQLLADSLVKSHLSPGIEVTVLLEDPLPLIIRNLQDLGADCRVASAPIDIPLLNNTLHNSSFDSCLSLGGGRLHREVKEWLRAAGNTIPHFTTSLEEL